jgi:hypothetical protein
MKSSTSPSWHSVAVNRNPHGSWLAWDGEVPFIRYEWFDGDIFIRRNPEGSKVTTYISCIYRSGTRRYASCTQDWGMEEHGLGIKISVNYVPDLLPQWQDIQTRVSRFVLDFKAAGLDGP